MHDSKPGTLDYVRRRYFPRLIAFICIVIIGQAALILTHQTVDPQVATDLALAAVNGGDAEMMAQRAYEATRRWAVYSTIGVYVVAFIILLGPVILEVYKTNAELKRKMAEENSRRSY
jgi:hypothetical protein